LVVAYVFFRNDEWGCGDEELQEYLPFTRGNRLEESLGSNEINFVLADEKFDENDIQATIQSFIQSQPPKTSESPSTKDMTCSDESLSSSSSQFSCTGADLDKPLDDSSKPENFKIIPEKQKINVQESGDQSQVVKHEIKGGIMSRVVKKNDISQLPNFQRNHRNSFQQIRKNSEITKEQQNIVNMDISKSSSFP